MTSGMIRNRLKPRFNKNFVKWRFANKKNKAKELHHIAGSVMGGRKLNDYLLAEIDKEFHTVITYNREPTQDEIDEMMVDAIEGMSDYIEHLEQTIILLNGQKWYGYTYNSNNSICNNRITVYDSSYHNCK